MYTAERPAGPGDYQEIYVDGRVFYKVCKPNQKAGTIRRRRYSDQFKDPAFVQKDINRKLRMIKQFREAHGDLEAVIQRWKDCVSECISILSTQYGIHPAQVFRAFPLGKWGFDIEDYGGSEDDLVAQNEG